MRNQNVVREAWVQARQGDMRKPSISVLWVMTLAMAILFTATAQARLVRVYYPEGHYLGCGTPAADGSGIWGYNASISEADCHDLIALRPDSSWYVSAYRLEDFNDLASQALSGFTPKPVRSPDGSFVTPAFDATHVESGTQTGVGASLRLNDWLALDLGLTVGSGTASRTSNLSNQEGVPQASEKADFRLFGASITAKVYPFNLQMARVQPWLSAGARGLALRPSGGTYTSRDPFVGDQRVNVPGRDFQTASTADLASGAGVDIRLTDRLGVTLSGDHGFRTGWRAGAAMTFALPGSRPRPWPLPCPYAGCDDPCPWCPWDPFPLPFPFPYLGAVHSEGLDAVLHSLREAAVVPSERQRTEKDLEELVKRSGHRFLLARNLETPGFDAFQVGWERGRVEDVTLTAIPGFERLKAGQKRYLLEVQRLVVEAPEKPAGRPFEDLGRKALKELGTTDAQVVLISASVASGSLDYWRGHSRTWSDAIAGYLGGDSKPLGISKFWGTVKTLAEADLDGAIEGALGTVVTGGGVLAGAAGGALGGTAVKAIHLLF